MTIQRRFTAGLLPILGLLLLPASVGASDCDTTSGNCFLLRAPAGRIQGIANAHGLAVKRQITPGDPNLVMVEGPTNILPEVTLANLHADADVTEVDMATLESLASTSVDSMIDAGTKSSYPAFNINGTYIGVEAAFYGSAQWHGYLGQQSSTDVQVPFMRDLADVDTFGAGVVAVIDTGVDPDHPSFQLIGGGSALVPGYDFLLSQPGIPSEWNALDPATAAQDELDLNTAADQSYSAVIEGHGVAAVVNNAVEVVVDQSYSAVIEGKDLPPAFGHGTMVAGIIRAVAPNAKIMPLRVFNGDGLASLDDIIEAIYYAKDNGAHVINMSFSVSSGSKAFSRALKAARRAKITLVTSAGNAGSSELTYPADYGEVIGVGSTDLDANYSAFSNTGPHVFLAAPGEAVATLFPGGNYAFAWGTSFSSAYVAGTVALLHSTGSNGSVTPVRPADVEGPLADSADAIPGQTPDMGAGRLDVEGTYNLENGNPDVD